MNVGYEEEELKPYIEPQPDYKDPKKTGRKRNSQKHLIRSCLLYAHRYGIISLFRYYATNGILPGGDPGLAGEPEV